MAHRFFGLTPSDKEIFLEHAFLLMYYGGFTYSECYKLPIPYRTWFIERINKEFQKAQDEGSNTSSRAAHHNDAALRQLQGMARGETPARMRRFT